MSHWLTESEPDEMLLFHYTKPKTFWSIVEGGEMWLSPYASTNDPRETKEWVAEVIMDVTDQDGEAQRIAADVRSLADSVLRGGARLACFTLDRHMTADAQPHSHFHRGWGRARMWLQYAGDHTGACLAFTRDVFVGQVDDHRPVRDGDMFSCGRVVYSDKPLKLAIKLVKIDRRDALGVLDDYQIERGVAGELYFTKNTEWVSETEFRVVVVHWNLPADQMREPLRIPHAPALRAIVLGERFPDADLDRLRAEMNRYPGVELVRCMWEGGSGSQVGAVANSSRPRPGDSRPEFGQSHLAPTAEAAAVHPR
jgi:hypothetical protein